MPNRDKQIEEMAKDLEDVCENKGCNYENGIRDCDKCRAEWLCELGYRKASDVAREIFAEIEKTAKDAMRFCDRYSVIPMIREAKTSCYKDLLGYITKLKKKYESEGAEGVQEEKR